MVFIFVVGLSSRFFFSHCRHSPSFFVLPHFLFFLYHKSTIAPHQPTTARLQDDAEVLGEAREAGCEEEQAEQGRERELIVFLVLGGVIVESSFCALAFFLSRRAPVLFLCFSKCHFATATAKSIARTSSGMDAFWRKREQNGSSGNREFETQTESSAVVVVPFF